MVQVKRKVRRKEFWHAYYLLCQVATSLKSVVSLVGKVT